MSHPEKWLNQSPVAKVGLTMAAIEVRWMSEPGIGLCLGGYGALLVTAIVASSIRFILGARKNTPF